MMLTSRVYKQNYNTIFNEDAFKNICKKTSLPNEMVQWTNYISLPNNTHGISKAVQIACKMNRLDIVQWIFDTYPFPITNLSISDNIIFRTACLQGNLETAKFVLSHVGYSNSIRGNVGGFPTNLNRDDIFHNILMTSWYNHPETLTWLFSIDNNLTNDEHFHFHINRTFVWSCRNNTDTSCISIILSYGANVLHDNDSAFLGACAHKRIIVAQWLSKLYPNRYKIISVEPNNVIVYEINKFSNVLDFFKTCDTPIIGKEECPICYNFECDTISTCGHIFCKSCVISHILSSERTNIICPMCRYEPTTFRFAHVEKEFNIEIECADTPYIYLKNMIPSLYICVFIISLFIILSIIQMANEFVQP